MTKTFDYDVLIVGGGAAGLTAAIYASRYNLKVIVVSFDFGGQILETGDIENWPGIKKISGHELSHSYEAHAKELGARLVHGTVTNITPEEIGFVADVDSGELKRLSVKAVILCAGAKHRKLGIKGEHELAGRGVSYCATCDAPFFRDKVVAVAGGGDSAVNGAVDLASNASKVYLIHRRKEFRAKPAYVDLARKNERIESILDTNVIEARGEGKLEEIVLDKPFDGQDVLRVDGLFIEIGFMPETTLSKGLGLKYDENGYIIIGKDQSTNVPGVFAAGDITNGSNRFAQLVTAASEGSIAAEGAFRYIQSLNCY